MCVGYESLGLLPSLRMACQGWPTCAFLYMCVHSIDSMSVCVVHRWIITLGHVHIHIFMVMLWARYVFMRCSISSTHTHTHSHKHTHTHTHTDEGRQSPGLRKLRKLQSNPNPEPGSSPLAARAVFDRRVSEPVLLDQAHGAKKDKKKLSGFFKKRNTQYVPLQEEGAEGKRSPVVSDRRKKKATASTSSWEDAMVAEDSPEPQRRLAPGNVSRPGSGATAGEGAPRVLRPRRPPPPVPSTTRAIHVAVDVDMLARRGSGEVSPDQEGGGDRRSSPRSPPTFPPSSKSPETPPEISEPGPAPSCRPWRDDNNNDGHFSLVRFGPEEREYGRTAEELGGIR